MLELIEKDLQYPAINIQQLAVAMQYMELPKRFGQKPYNTSGKIGYVRDDQTRQISPAIHFDGLETTSEMVRFLQDEVKRVAVPDSDLEGVKIHTNSRGELDAITFSSMYQIAIFLEGALSRAPKRSAAMTV